MPLPHHWPYFHRNQRLGIPDKKIHLKHRPFAMVIEQPVPLFDQHVSHYVFS